MTAQKRYKTPEVATLSEEEAYEFSERAGILEDNGLTREEAEREAWRIVRGRWEREAVDARLAVER